MEYIFDKIEVIPYMGILAIVVSTLFADMIVGLIAAIASGRHIKSSIMVACQDKKMQSFFRYIAYSVGFYVAAMLCKNVPEMKGLCTIAKMICIIPAIPELVSIFENIKIAKTGEDTKKK